MRIRSRDYWLGTDEAIARELYADVIESVWRPGHDRALAKQSAPSGRLTLSQAAEMMYEYYDSTRPTTVGGGGGSTYWRKHARRFDAGVRSGVGRCRNGPEVERSWR